MEERKRGAPRLAAAVLLVAPEWSVFLRQTIPLGQPGRIAALPATAERHVSLR